MTAALSFSESTGPMPAKSQAPETVFMFVSPEKAREWLAKNQQNRKLKKRVIDRLAKDIKEGRWKITHQGIAFDIHGSLRDGQHRLHAILLANIGVWLNVTFGIDPASLLVIDNIVIRSSADQMTIAGGFGIVGHEEISVLRRMISGLSQNTKLSIGEEMEQLSKHRTAIQFALKQLPRVAGGTAASRAAIARAYYSADEKRLMRFCEVLRTGMATNEDEQPIVKLWRDLTSRNTTGVGGSEQRVRYSKTERALQAYLNGETLGHLYASSKELFPLPGEFDDTKTPEPASA